MSDLSISSVSLDLHYFAFAAAQVSLAATQRFVVVETMTSKADKMCFVSVNGNNVFQDNHVKLCVVTFVYVYFINIQEKQHQIFLSKNPLIAVILKVPMQQKTQFNRDPLISKRS